MNAISRALVVAPLVIAAGAAAAGALSRDLAPNTIEGTLVAAECVVAGDPRAQCSQRALSGGQPGGVLAGAGFTMLLIDGRILARTCGATASGRLRASGVLHHGGAAMSTFRLEENCGQGWAVVAVPHAGTLADGAAGGDE